MKSFAAEYIEKNSASVLEVARKMWAEPETAWNEVKAARWNAELLEKNGFTVETGYLGLPTAVRGVWGSGKPVIGFLGELDALPALSQKVSTRQEEAVPGAPGQGCGHNLLAGACLAAAIGLKAEMESRKMTGTIIYYGCPAEEVLTGKPFMARGGAFRELDVAFAWHGATFNEVSLGTMTGLNSAVFHFKGRTAHAGGAPQDGRSALDAVELMNVGANYLREHVTDDVRIHYVIKNGGAAPNIVPGDASVWYYVRALSRATVEETYERLVKIAKGAAMMTETEMRIEYLGGCYNTMENKALVEMTHEVMKEVPLPVWTAEELAFADEMNRNSPIYDKMKRRGLLDGAPIADFVSPIGYENGFGSTDVGDVEHIVPGVQVNTATHNIAAPGHSWQLTACSGHSIGEKGMLYGAKVMAAAAVRLLETPRLLEQAKAEFAERTKAEPYICPITQDMPVPQPKE